MSIKRTHLTRRSFVRSIGSSAALLATIGTSRTTTAGPQRVLPSRVNAQALMLNYNENSLGMSPKAVTASQAVIQHLGNRYPDDAVEELRENLAALHGVNKDQVIFGNGSTEVIQALVTMAEGRGAKVVEPMPTFGDVDRYAKAEGLEVIKVPVGAGFETDIEQLRSTVNKLQGTVLINICNPNNPTGTIVDKSALSEWVSNAPDEHIFLIDEAYFDYAQQNPKYQSLLPLIKSGKENLVITRTFSKIYGMAGMRIGYGIAAPRTAKEVRKFAAGYNLSAAGTAAALASLQDHEFYKMSMASNRAAKNTLIGCLDELELEHIDSNTNFVLHRINSKLSDYALHMLDNGIRVGRRMTTADGWNRISIGTPSEMDVFVQVLRDFRKLNWV